MNVEDWGKVDSLVGINAFDFIDDGGVVGLDVFL